MCDNENRGFREAKFPGLLIMTQTPMHEKALQEITEKLKSMQTDYNQLVEQSGSVQNGLVYNVFGNSGFTFDLRSEENAMVDAFVEALREGLPEERSATAGYIVIDPSKYSSKHMQIYGKCGTFGHKQIAKEMLMEDLKNKNRKR